MGEFAAAWLYLIIKGLEASKMSVLLGCRLER